GAEPVVEEFVRNEVLVARCERFFPRAITRHDSRPRIGRPRGALKKIEADGSAVGETGVPFVQREDRPRDVQDFRRAVIPGSELSHFVKEVAVRLPTPPGRLADQNRGIVHPGRRPRDGALLLSPADAPPPGGHAHALGGYDMDSASDLAV